jgi:large subunit ribosomal protein L24
MARHVRKGDVVLVTSGKDRGKQGSVLRVLPGGGKLVVEGVNVRRKNIKRNQNNPQGGVIDIEMPIDASNVSPAVDGKPTRVRFQTLDDGSKVRIAVRGGGKIGQELKKARKQ